MKQQYRTYPLSVLSTYIPNETCRIVLYVRISFWQAGGTTAVLHYDDYENLLCQLRGTKELVLFPPKDLENLYYVGRRKGKLKYDFPGKWTRYLHVNSIASTTR